MSADPGAQRHQLRELARLYGVQTDYYDIIARRRTEASPEALLAVLRALGASINDSENLSAALREKRQALWRRCVEPVVVAWEGRPLRIKLRLPACLAEAPLVFHLHLENGTARTRTLDATGLAWLRAAEVEGTRYVVKALTFPETCPRGYHRLTTETPRGSFETLVIAAPTRAYPPAQGQSRTWGIFLPLYALRSRESWGAGDLSDLESLLEWVAELGGGAVATLPLLATFLDEPFDPSPYAPASRLFWNEFYLDLTRSPELPGCPAARALLESSEFRRQRERLRASTLVDYRGVMALKRAVLEELAKTFFSRPSDRRAAFQGFLKAQPAVEDYARFRATGERRRTAWPAWPAPLRDGLLRQGDYDEESRRYHLYAQWLAYEQLTAFSRKAREKGAGLYLDLPLGVHPEGYDVWRERTVFACEVSGGAPPDSFFTKGQNWRFPPLHPAKIREAGYRYFIACLRHHLRPAGILRIDHVMGLHRLFWIPQGAEARDGAYVRYRAEELYAILALESHRTGTLIVGEDLGTVPPSVAPAMARHNIYGMYTLQYELRPQARRALRPASRKRVASMNTHDMPPFASFWQGLDIQDRLELGLLDQAGAGREREKRDALKQALISFLRKAGSLKGSGEDGAEVLRACLAYLAASPAPAVIVNLEDLWGETHPQNVPGIQEGRPNWRRKARYSLEAFCALPQVLDTLRELNQPRGERRLEDRQKQ